MQFQTYQKYKPSGIDWLGEVPEGWKVKRFSDVFSFNKGLSITKENLQENGIYCVNYGEIHSKYGFEVDPNKHKLLCVDEEYLKLNRDSLLKYGDFVFADTSEDIEGSGNFTYLNSQEKTFAGYHTIIAKPIKKLNYRFIAYLFDTEKHRSQIRKKVTGIKVFSITKRILKDADIFFPDNKTQTAIADYLDNQTALIDKKIELLKAKKQSYIKLKQILINEVVTKGLETTVEMKDSGIEWIGQIPKHWKTKRLKQIFDERVEKNRLPNGDPVTENILSVMKDVGVINHRDKGLVGNKMSEDITGYKLVHIDDIVVNKMNVMIGSVGISKEFGALSVIYIILKAKSSHLPKFYDYLFRIKRFQKHLRTISTGILEIREAVNTILFMGQEFPIPPKPEQISIANYLDEKTSNIDQIVKKINENILALQEFRKTLINDVVTGKVKVL